MRYSFMSFSTPEMTFSEMLAAAREYGYDGIEPRLDVKHNHGLQVTTEAARLKEMAAEAREAGVAICCLATSLRFADPAATQQMVADARERIDLAGAVGAPVLRIFGGQVPEGVRRDQAIGVVAEALSALADQAKDRGVTLCMETHDHWCDPAHVAAVLERVDHPNVACNWDILHPVRVAGATIESSFETLRPWIRHLHVHDGVWDEKLEMVPIGTGKVDHRKAIELLQTIDYDGYISGEWINWTPPEEHLPREVKTLRSFE